MNAQNIALWCFLIFSIIVLLFAFVVLWKMWKGEISLVGLIAETVPDPASRTPRAGELEQPGSPPPVGTSAAPVHVEAPPTRDAATPAIYGVGSAGVVYTKASLARFQFLIFTFVIAGLFLLLSIEAGTFVEIPTNVLGLLGISAASYGVGKAIK